jgi:hypothetical protein
MLEYFTYKKIKKHQTEKRASTPSTPNHVEKHHSMLSSPQPTPLLTEEDENFLQRVVSAEGTPPPLPDRPLGWMSEAGDSTSNNAQMVIHDGNDTTAEHTKNGNHTKQDKGKGKENEKAQDKNAKKPGRFSFLTRSGTKKVNLQIPQLIYHKSVP